jgi:hypothetical protein
MQNLRTRIMSSFKLVAILIYILTAIVIHTALSEDEADRVTQGRMPLLGFSYRMLDDNAIPGSSAVPAPRAYEILASSK